MTFNQAINKIMHEVESGSQEPFIVFRNADGGWHCDTTVNQYGEKYDWVDDIQDPFALTFTGEDFAKASYPAVYDRILNERLRAEHDNAFFPNADTGELSALMNLLEENIGEFSSEVTEYLTLYDRPLAALYEMTPISLKSDNPDHDYDYDKVGAFVEAVEAEIHDKIYNRKKQYIPKEIEGSNDGYSEISKLSINDSDIIFSENPDAEYRYMVAENRNTPYYNISGNNNIYTGHTNDYLEAITEFSERVQNNVACVQSRRDLLWSSEGIDYRELKKADCLQDSHNDDYTGKLLIVKASELQPEYRSSENQLVICTHGNGARPNAKGTSVFGQEVQSGQTACYSRHQIEGVADPDKLPQWAINKLAEPHHTNETLKEPPLKEQDKSVDSPTKKPTLQEKLNAAKERAKDNNAKNNNRGDKPKNRDARE